MAKQRYINTKFWSDTFISELNPLDRYLFLYFLTNEHTNIAGIYELPIKTIAFETGIELDMVRKMLKRLTSKVMYIEGWVCIKNFQKHQATSSKDVQEGIKREMSNIPDNVRVKLEEGYKKDEEDRGSIEGLGRVSYTKPNLTKLDYTKPNADDKESSGDITILIKAFEGLNPASKKFYGIPVQRKACKSLIETYGLDRVIGVVEKTLPKTNGLQFFPVITTPLQLSDKWVALESAIRKYQSEKLTTKDKYPKI